jgi:hypothetical protein
MMTVDTFCFSRNTSRIVKYMAGLIAVLLFSVIALSRTRALAGAPLIKTEIRWNMVAKSLSIFERYVRYDHDMDVQMLLAGNYKELHQHDKAEKHLKHVAMCLGGFMPFYELVKIIDKEIKIPSATVIAIKNEMRQLPEKKGNRDSATQGGTGDEPKSYEPRQGETPEVSPRGGALPP